MRKYLLPPTGNFYKANLHCHSVLSDGKYTPEHLKEIYKERGYSVLSITDHNKLIKHDDLNDETFLSITGYEADLSAYRHWYDNEPNHTPVVHVNFFSKYNSDAMPCYDPTRWLAMPDQNHVGDTYERSYYRLNEFIERTCKEGFLCTFNHPTWSCSDLHEYDGMKGFFAVEVCNYGCYTEGYQELDEHVLDDMLRRGNKVFVTATDDNHNNFPVDHPRCDSFGGFDMIKAEKLEYSAIIEALEKGNFYASMGPEIKELYIEDEYLYVKTSPVEKIFMKCFGRGSRVASGDKKGDLITEARCNINGLTERYIRVVLYDGQGKYAWSQPCWDPLGIENGKYGPETYRRIYNVDGIR